MKCSVCGSELPENAKFCIFCGSTLKTAAPEAPTYAPPSYTPPAQPEQPAYNPAGYNPQNSLYQQPTYNPAGYNSQNSLYQQPSYTPPVPADSRETVVVPAKPVKKAKKGGKKWIAVTAIIAAVLAVVVIAGIVILNIPSVKVPMALSRSMKAYAGISDDIGLTKALAFLEDKASTESLTLTFEGINSMIADTAAADGVDLSQFETLGVRFDSSTSLAERRMSGSFALVYEGSDLIKANLGVDDDTVWVAVPDLLSGKYGIKTSTLGMDLVEMGAMEAGSGIESLGFNIFDLIELMMTLEPSEDLQKEFADAAEDLTKALEMEADGSDEIKVNGKRINCSLYNVTIPQDALEDYLDAIEDPMNDYMDEYLDVIFELFESIGMPEDILEEMKYEMPSVDMGMYTDTLKEALDYIGDVELEVYLKGGYVMAVIYELEVDRETMVITANMGGEGKYEDDFSLTVEMEDYFTFELSSSGNHTGKGGEFTDKTELEITVDGERGTIALESSYAPKEKEDNFQCELTFSEIFFGVPAGVEAEGQLTLEKNNLHMELDEVSVAVAGMDMVTVGVDYSIGEYTGAAESGSVKYITKLTEDDLMAMGEELMTNAQVFAEDLVEKVPFIQAILNAQVPAYPEEAYPSDGYYYG